MGTDTGHGRRVHSTQRARRWTRYGRVTGKRARHSGATSGSCDGMKRNAQPIVRDQALKGQSDKHRETSVSGTQLIDAAEDWGGARGGRGPARHLRCRPCARALLSAAYGLPTERAALPQDTDMHSTGVLPCPNAFPLTRNRHRCITSFDWLGPLPRLHGYGKCGGRSQTAAERSSIGREHCAATPAPAPIVSNLSSASRSVFNHMLI
jgi:hypothetical protein